MTKTKVVLQTSDGCVVLINPEEKQYKGFVHVVNPNLHSVRGIPPEEWRIEKGHVVADYNTCLVPPEEANVTELDRLVAEVHEKAHKLEEECSSIQLEASKNVKRAKLAAGALLALNILTIIKILL